MYKNLQNSIIKAKSLRSSWVICVVFVLSCVFSSGCMPYLWITPPVKVSTSFGGSILLNKRPESDLAAQKGPQMPGIMNINFGIYPLQAPEFLRTRSFDIGLGYHVSTLYFSLPEDERFPLHGPYLEGIWYVHNSPLYEGSWWRSRVGLHLQPRLLFLTSGLEDRYGFAANVKVSVEISYHTPGGEFSECDRKGCIFGAYYGEFAIGLFAQTGYGFLGRTHFWDVRVGVHLNIPITGGVGFVWLK